MRRSCNSRWLAGTADVCYDCYDYTFALCAQKHTFSFTSVG